MMDRVHWSVVLGAVGGCIGIVVLVGIGAIQPALISPGLGLVLAGLLVVMGSVTVLVGRRLRQLEAALAQLQAASGELQRITEERDWFISVVSHELRTPLTGLRSLLQLVVEDRVPPGREREFLLLALEQVDRLSRLIHDLLDLQDLRRGREALDLDAADLDQVVQAAMVECQALAAQQDVALRLDLPAALPTMTVDADRLRQVFLNLVSNAVRYSPAGGEVVVGGQVTENEVRFYVADGGPGIPPHLMPHLFEPFARTRDRSRVESVGLGLAIARAIVQSHGGRIWVESQEGRGTTFWFALSSQGMPTARR